MKDYCLEHNSQVDLRRLQTGRIPLDEYSPFHARMIRACHDVIIQYNGSALLVTRNNEPLRGEIWPIGGGVERGVPTVESLCRLAKSESGLELHGIEFVGAARTFLQTDPFNHGRGTDSLNLMYFAVGSGKIVLDKNHFSPVLISPDEFSSSFRANLHPYVLDFLELVMHKIRQL